MSYPDRRTVQALLQDGPADGAVRPVKRGPTGRPPPLLMLSGGKLFVGSANEPAPTTYPTYELEPEPIDATLWPYRHVETLTI